MYGISCLSPQLISSDADGAIQRAGRFRVENGSIDEVTYLSVCVCMCVCVCVCVCDTCVNVCVCSLYIMDCNRLESG